MNLQTTNLSDLRIFYEVVKNMSFTKSASELKLSKSTVSERISALESDLGQSLILRTTRKIRLTEAGEIFYKRIAILMKSIKNAEDELSEMTGQQSGMIKVSAPRGYEESSLVESLVNFNKLYPSIQIQIDFTDRIIDFLSEEYDLVLRVGDLKDSSLVSKKIASHHFRFVCSPTYKKNCKNNINLMELDFNDYVEFKMKDMPTWKVSQNGSSIYKNIPNGNIQSNSIKFIKNFLISGKGFSFLPDFLFESEIESNELVVFMNNYVGKEMKVYVVYPSKRFLLPRVRALIDTISKAETLI